MEEQLLADLTSMFCRIGQQYLLIAQLQDTLRKEKQNIHFLNALWEKFASVHCVAILLGRCSNSHPSQTETILLGRTYLCVVQNSQILCCFTASSQSNERKCFPGSVVICEKSLLPCALESLRMLHGGCTFGDIMAGLLSAF